VAEEVSKVQGVAKVLVAQHDVYKGFLAGESYSYLLTKEVVFLFAIQNKIAVNFEQYIFILRGTDSLDFGNS